MSLENVGVVETLLILRGSLCDFLLELVDSVSKWMFSAPVLLHKVSLFQLRPGIYNCHQFFMQFHVFRVESSSMDFRCVHLFQLLKVHNQYVSCSDSPCVQYMNEEYSREQFLSKLVDS